MKALWMPFYYIFWCIFQILRGMFSIVFWVLKAIFYQKKKTEPVVAKDSPEPATKAVDMLFEPKKEVVDEPEEEIFIKQEKSKEPGIKKVGNITPSEEDHNLRAFTVFNNEGEIFRINTASPGPFYGPLWTRILSCHENRETLCARLICPVYGKSTNQSGYRVKIGGIRAFMPNYHSLRYGDKEGINVRVAIIEVNPVTQRILVSSRLAYDLLFAHHPEPKVGEMSEALYWDYDDEKIYFLLPGRYAGWTEHHQPQTKIASLMGTITSCHIESLKQQEHEAIVSLVSPCKENETALPIADAMVG